MNYEEKAIRFLATEENLPMALEIANIVERLKVRLHREFWQGLFDKLNRKLASTDKFDRWRVEFDQKNNRVRFCPSYIAETQHYFMLGLQPSGASDGYLFNYGFIRSHPSNLSKETRLEEIYKLSKAVQSEGFRDDEGWWLGFKRYSCTNVQFLLRMINDKEVFIDEMVQIMWHMLEKHYLLLENAHHALSFVE